MNRPYRYYSYVCQFCADRYNYLQKLDYYMRGHTNSPITIKYKEIKYVDNKIKENLKVPVLFSNINPQVLKYINDNIENDIMEFKRQMEVSAHNKSIEDNKKVVIMGPYFISNSYEITYNKNDIISISIIYYEYVNGKHIYIRVPYNYNIKTGNPVSLKDLFKAGVDYISLINNEIKKKLQQDSDKYLPYSIKDFSGISEDQPFYLENEDIVIFFQFGESASTLSKIPVIKLPLTSFENNINPMLLRGPIIP